MGADVVKLDINCRIFIADLIIKKPPGTIYSRGLKELVDFVSDLLHQNHVFGFHIVSCQ